MQNRRYNFRVGIYDQNINHFVYDVIPKNKVCLDIGCWTGNLGEMLIKQKECIVDGIDENQKVLRAAKKKGYRRVFEINLNFTYKIKREMLNNNKYDVIIFADVLEHLINPKMVLEGIGRFLKRDGIIIVSVPNVAFILQRCLLVVGRFNYDPDGGIMDSTHLRFFTKKTVERLAIESGYRIMTSKGYNLVRERFFFLRPLGAIFPNIFALQFLLTLCKR